MATQLLESMETGMAVSERETLRVLSGISLVVFGTGLILSTPAVQRLLSRIGMGGMVHGVLPDLERYLRLRSM